MLIRLYSSLSSGKIVQIPDDSLQAVDLLLQLGDKGVEGFAGACPSLVALSLLLLKLEDLSGFTQWLWTRVGGAVRPRCLGTLLGLSNGRIEDVVVPSLAGILQRLICCAELSIVRSAVAMRECSELCQKCDAFKESTYHLKRSCRSSTSIAIWMQPERQAFISLGDLLQCCRLVDFKDQVVVLCHWYWRHAGV